MTQYHPEAPTVAISHARSFEKNEAFLQRHLPLAKAIGERATHVVVLNGAHDRTDHNLFSTYYTFSGDSLRRHDEVVSVASALDLTGGIARYTPEVAALNPLAIREIALSKQSQYDALRSLGDHVPQTATARADRQSVLDTLDLFEAKKFIVKPEGGDVTKKHGMLAGTRDEIIAGIDSVLETMDAATDTVVVQEYMDQVHAPFARGLIYASNDEKEAALSLDKLGREIRVHTIDGRPILVTGRAGLDAAHKSPLDDWIYLNQESVPAHITDLAGDAAQLIMRRAQATSAYLAIDLTPDGSRVVEVNGRNIGTMRLDPARPASKEAHTITTNNIAEKLVSMAHNNRKGQ